MMTLGNNHSIEAAKAVKRKVKKEKRGGRILYKASILLDENYEKVIGWFLSRGEAKSAAKLASNRKMPAYTDSQPDALPLCETPYHVEDQGEIVNEITGHPVLRRILGILRSRNPFFVAHIIDYC